MPEPGTMFDLIFGFRLLLNAFSTNRNSLRFPYPKRIIAVFFFLPSFLLLILINRVFMALDWIFSPWFCLKKINQPVFIVGTPRSATTYLYDTLASDKEHFTATRFWEMIFAPSILQKLFFRFLSFADSITGRPLYRLSRIADRLLFSRMKGIHQLSFSKPEEDEILLSYAMSSLILVFFFPEQKLLDRLLYFDELMPERKRKRLMRFYKRCVQRHLFVFDMHNKKSYLSKNPCFICKLNSIAETFPESKLIYTLRSPYRTIPSTISLNANLYSFFARRNEESPLAEITRDTVIRWYKMADSSIRENWNERHIVVPFKKITRETGNTLTGIYNFLEREMPPPMKIRLQEEDEKNKTYSSGHRYDEKAGVDDSVIAKELGFILNGPFADQI